MLAARDQENLTHAHRAAAASKPLNQTSHAPKTPAAKTQSRTVAKNNENVAFTRGKKTEKIQLVTPAAKDRAPLGAKTTNAKSQLFQTPGAPLTAKKEGTGFQRTQRTSARRPKLKVHHTPEPIGEDPIQSQLSDDVDARLNINDGNDSEFEIEHCPPKIVPLPDYDPDDPDDDTFSVDHKFPTFDSRDIIAAYQDHVNPIGTDGLRKWERERAQYEKDSERILDEALHKHLKESEEQFDNLILGDEEIQRNVAKTQKQEQPSTSDSRLAANALSTRASAKRSGASFAAPTSASQGRSSANPTSINASAKVTRGTLASRNTLGYSNGRKVSSTLKQEAGSQRHVSTGLIKDKRRSKNTNEISSDSNREARLDKLFKELNAEDADEGIEKRSELEAQQRLDALFRDPGLMEFRLDLPGKEFH